MPVYVYRNLETGETFEYQQRISEPALTAHPETGQPVKRLIQPVGIAFKGSGFYVNDSRSSSSSSNGSTKSSNGADGSPDSSSKGSESTSGGDSGASGSTSNAGTSSTPAAAAS